jgi:hypothetical protein
MEYLADKYATTRFINALVATIGWILLAAGVLMTIIGLATGTRVGSDITGLQATWPGAGFLTIVPGLSAVLAGLMLISVGQTGRAFLDASIASQQLVQLMQEGAAGTGPNRVRGPAWQPPVAADHQPGGSASEASRAAGGPGSANNLPDGVTQVGVQFFARGSGPFPIADAAARHLKAGR